MACRGEDTRVLDLFAGTGALGLEAISRGAAQALFVETSVEGRGLIRTNVEALGLTGVTRILRRDATVSRPRRHHRFLRSGLLRSALRQGPRRGGAGERASAGWIKAEAICVLEEVAARTVELPAGFECPTSGSPATASFSLHALVG